MTDHFDFVILGSGSTAFAAALAELPAPQPKPVATPAAPATYNRGRTLHPPAEAAMLKFEGDRDFALAPADLWTKLTDPRFPVQCLPDVETVKESDAEHAAVVLRPSFAFVRGTLDMTMRVVDPAPPTSARVLVHSKGIG